MNWNKHLLLWSSLGVLGLLVLSAWQENYLKEWRKIQRVTRSEAGPLDVRLRQVVVPELRTTDRCVTCHLGMVPGETVAGPSPLLRTHPPVVHDPADFGCTVCHGGQRLATEKADAHGDVPFWPEPMIPLRSAESGCGSCHTYVAIPELKQLAHGRNLVERYDCLLCHRLDGRGGTLRTGGTGGSEVPDLSRVGLAGWDKRWYNRHREKSRSAGDPRWQGTCGPIEPAARKAIDGFLATRVAAPRLLEAASLFHSLGCRGCHKVGGVGGEDGPDLTEEGRKDPGQLDFSQVPGERTLGNWLAEHFRAPARVVPGSLMPALGLEKDRIELLTQYLLSLRRGDFSGSFWPRDRVRTERLGEREFAGDGATLYAAFCSACHGARGEGMRYAGLPPFPAIANPDFLAVASDAFLTETIRRGRPGRRMAAWGDADHLLRSGEITAIVGQLRRLGRTPAPAAETGPARWARGEVAAGGRLFATLCQGCHGDQGQGREGPALRNPALLRSATDTYLAETIRRGRKGTAMPAFSQPSPVHPALGPDEIASLITFLRTWEQP